jgi:hypothetical protein
MDAAKNVDNVVDAAKQADNVVDATKTATPPKTPEAPKNVDNGPSCVRKPNSFVPGTKVLLSDGKSKAIEDLKVGDELLASDVETGDSQQREVTDVRRVEGKKTLVTVTVDTDGDNGSRTGKITSTDNHLIWLPDAGTWVQAGDLKPGMWLETAAGTWVQITAVEHSTRHERVHNLTVDGVHTYNVLAGGVSVLVHNCGGADPTHADSCRCANGAPARPAVKEGEVGRFGDLDGRKRAGDGLTPNHIPQAALNFLPYRDHAAVMMTHADHLLTRTYGAKGRATKALDRGASFRDVLARDLMDLRKIGQDVYGDPGHFNQQIKEIIKFYRTNHPHLL